LKKIFIHVSILGNGFHVNGADTCPSLGGNLATIRMNLQYILVNRRFFVDPSWMRIMCSIAQYALSRSTTRSYAKYILQIARARSMYEMWPSVVVPLDLILKNKCAEI
jgi:hypothetical protein